MRGFRWVYGILDRESGDEDGDGIDRGTTLLKCKIDSVEVEVEDGVRHFPWTIDCKQFDLGSKLVSSAQGLSSSCGVQRKNNREQQ